jgi:hypothetical protein
VRKILPDTMFVDAERTRLTMLRTWVLDNDIAESRWRTFSRSPRGRGRHSLGRVICVPDMPVEAQRHLGNFDKRNPDAI